MISKEGNLYSNDIYSYIGNKNQLSYKLMNQYSNKRLKAQKEKLVKEIYIFYNEKKK